jgi:tetratricopeptide (TPR) repeat protein
MGLLSLFRKDFKALKQRGDRYAAEGQWALARGEYEDALARYQGGDDAARDAVKAALQNAGTELYGLHVRQGDAAWDAELDEEALDHYRMALSLVTDAKERARLEKRVAEILEGDEHRRANADAMAFEEQEATEDAFNAENPDERFELLLEGTPEEVADHYLELGPEFRDAFLVMHDGDAKEALARFDRLLKADAPDPYVQLERGRALLVLERFDEAVRALRAYCAVIEDDPAALRMLADALHGLKRHDEALAVLEDVRAQRPDDVESHVALGQHHLAVKDWDDGVEAIAVGLEQVPYPLKRIPLWRTMGQLLLGKGDEKGAIGAWEKVLEAEWEIDNETGELHFDRETAWLLTGLYAKRKEELQRAMDLVKALELAGADEERWQLLLRRGQLLFLMGDQEEAREALLRARATAPEAGDQRALLEKLLAQLDGG